MYRQRGPLGRDVSSARALGSRCIVSEGPWLRKIIPLTHRTHRSQSQSRSMYFRSIKWNSWNRDRDRERDGDVYISRTVTVHYAGNRFSNLCTWVVKGLAHDHRVLIISGISQADPHTCSELNSRIKKPEQNFEKSSSQASVCDNSRVNLKLRVKVYTTYSKILNDLDLDRNFSYELCSEPNLQCFHFFFTKMWISTPPANIAAIRKSNTILSFMTGVFLFLFST